MWPILNLCFYEFSRILLSNLGFTSGIRDVVKNNYSFLAKWAPPNK
jgi:hypothetical protein